MSTVVFQSFRRHGVPDWITACMESVRTWAGMRGFEYQFFDDRLFDCVPEWFRHKTRHVCTLADMARLITARNLIEAGWDRVIWVDADVLVFAPERLLPGRAHGFALCLEAWFQLTSGRARCDYRVNNAIAVFSRDDNYLGFLIEASTNIARARPVLGKLEIGTRLFTQLNRVAPLPLLDNIGMFSPIVMANIAAHTDHFLPSYARHLPTPLAAANLCLSLQNSPAAAADIPHRVVDACMETNGEVINRFVPRRSARDPVKTPRDTSELESTLHGPAAASLQTEPTS